MFDYRFILDDNLELDTNIPPMVIQPYIENAINHGLYNLKDKAGKLIIRMDQLSTSTLKVTVHDNGVGRKAGKALRRKRHKSRGLQIIHERIETINKSNDLEIEVTVDDLMEDGLPAGTEVTILIRELE